MKTAIYPGSFDPVTKGHMDVISRASELFDQVIVLVSVNKSKTYSFEKEKRVEMLQKTTEGLSNVKVESFDGLLAAYAVNFEKPVVIKGLRAMTDFEYEFQMALVNKKLNSNLETVFLTTDSEYMYLSSSVVKQIAELSGDISEFVPACVKEDILKKYKK